MDQKDSCCAPRTVKNCSNAADKTNPDIAALITDTKGNCCPPSVSSGSCCSPPKGFEKAGYRIEPFVKDWRNTPQGEIPLIKRKLTFSDRRGRWAMRWGFGRSHYLVTPGLYAIGSPDENSEVLISANYKLSFDTLRSSIKDVDAWILVIDTKGVNVWCAAGKGTFGTAEIVRRVKMVDLKNLVTHRRLIVPQLGAPGVAAHIVKKDCGFNVVYGPVRASDLPAFLAEGREATAAMRQVSFTLLERAVLTPVEITLQRRQILYVTIALLLLGGFGRDIFSFSAVWTRGGGAILAGLAGVFAGSVLTPILLPWLPGRAFALKGVWPGLAVAIALGSSLFYGSGYLNQSALLLEVTAISSVTAMNFTGSSTYTSPSGVEKEMRMAIPGQLAAVVLGLILWLWSAF